MSITIDTVRTGAGESGDDGPERNIPPAAWFAGDALDVTGLPFDRVAAYARRADGDVHFERRGGRTLLVA